MSKHLSLVRSARMAAIDQETIAAGTPGHELMCRAGAGVWAAAVDHFAFQPDTKTLFLCGKGNNGGDGFVAATIAKSAGYDPTIILFADVQDVTGDALYHLNRARDAGVDLHTFAEYGTTGFEQSLTSADVLFDCLLGTGTSGAPRPPLDRAIAALREFQGRIIAVDTPSGMDPDTGEGLAADAHLTVTFGGLKPGHVFYPGKARCGHIASVDIGLSEAAVDANCTGRVSFSGASPALPKRSRTAHKGDAGRALVIAGSAGLTGAACLTSEAALRSGTGLVTLGLPETLNDIAEVKLTEVMTCPLPEVRKHRCLSLRARGRIRELGDIADAVALGPGLGTHHETIELVRRLISDIDAPTVLDADALNACAGQVAFLRKASQPLILTPHPGEYRRLTGTAVDDPMKSASQLAEDAQAVVILKGAPTVIALPDGSCYVNITGNPGMATGGTGDALTGILVGLLAQGVTPKEAALIGTYWHGLAGDLAADRLGERGMLAGDLVASIPLAEMQIQTGRSSQRYLSVQSS
jgi:ADP-dependent NAD(P)H-hydrate dehydratase / NAD(P)H-hydrate epimerase